MNCKYRGCKNRATKYLLNKVRLFDLNTPTELVRAHPYCSDHWTAVRRRYWS